MQWICVRAPVVRRWNFEHVITPHFDSLTGERRRGDIKHSQTQHDLEHDIVQMCMHSDHGFDGHSNVRIFRMYLLTRVQLCINSNSHTHIQSEVNNTLFECVMQQAYIFQCATTDSPDMYIFAKMLLAEWFETMIRLRSTMHAPKMNAICN